MGINMAMGIRSLALTLLRQYTRITFLLALDHAEMGMLSDPYPDQIDAIMQLG